MADLLTEIIQRIQAANPVDLGLRLGEGSGAALAYPMVQAAALILNEMATFADAGISTEG